MAFRTTSYWKSMMSRLGGNSSNFTTSTAPKLKPFAPTAESMVGRVDHRARLAKGEYVPVYVALGMILTSATLGLYTAKQHLLYDPGVRLRKKLRETLPEVAEPDLVLHEANNLVQTSVFRKVAHVQEGLPVPDCVRGDSYASNNA